MIFMKPIHNILLLLSKNLFVVIPHKVNDFYETNSQHIFNISTKFSVVIPHKVNDFYETNSQPCIISICKRKGCDSSQS